MLEAVFISDLHLHPQEPLISTRFDHFIEWALDNTRALYVLGDLFHVWAGDDCADQWSLAIAQQFRRLRDKGIALYYMPGNRDFLLGEAFAQIAGFECLKDPSLIQLNDEPVLLAHGDAYCLLDKSHQRFRRITRNKLFIKLFLLLPKQLRIRLVMTVRQKSEQKHRPYGNVSLVNSDVVAEALLKDLKRNNSLTLIHGHTHRPGLNLHTSENQVFRRYVLSDWDDIPDILCYDKSKGFDFIHII